MLMNQIAPQNEATVRNLITAFECESNAHAKYTAYAAKAESEGLHRTAALLRAAARSERIHADNHARVIRQLGGEPEAQVQPVEVNETLENLITALGDEIYEIESMYPRFLAENRSTRNSAARSFSWAHEAEKTHASLLIEEIKRVETGNANSALDARAEFYVRPVCGLVSDAPEQQRCWACERFCSSFETIR